MNYLIPLFVLTLSVPLNTFDEMGGLQDKKVSELLFQDKFDYTQGDVEQARGFYADGSLVNAAAFPLVTESLIELFPKRERYFATTDLVRVVRRVSKSLQKKYPRGERLQLGDASQRAGGEVSGHVSHQNGLDLDIAYLRRDHWEQDLNEAAGFLEDFVKDTKVTANFDLQRNWFLVKELVKTGRVNRIFVNAQIKQALCNFAKRKGEFKKYNQALRRLRPWQGHADHLHLRLTCPRKSPACITQVEIPEGQGCDRIALGES